MRNAPGRYGAILASALMFMLYARVEQPWALLGWVALIPWLVALERERSTAAAIWSGVAMSAAFTLAVFAWFALAVARYTHGSPLLSFSLLILAAPALQPQFIVFAALRHTLSARGQRRCLTAVAVACAWVGTEWLRPHLFADTLGHGLFPFATLRQGADLAGAPGLTFVILLVNESLYAAIRHWRRAPRHAALAGASALLLVSALAAYGELRWQQVTKATPHRAPLTAALIQANLDDYEGLRARVGSFEAVRTILGAHETLSRQALSTDGSQRSVDLLVWPETVYPTTFGKPKSPAGATFDDEIMHFAASTGVPLLFGTYDRAGDREFNAAVLLQPDSDEATRSDVYRKRNLFPLTEEVPAWLDSTFIRNHLPWLGTWRAGDGAQVLTLHLHDGSSVHVAPLICRDAVDPSLAIDAARRGADLLLTLSNDAWFAHSRGAQLHLAVSAFRSIETRLPQLRATNTGISAVISATGDIVARTAVGRPVALTGRIRPGSRGSTLMSLWGDWFGPAACVFALLLSALSMGRRSSAPDGRRRQEKAPPGTRPGGAFPLQHLRVAIGRNCPSCS